MRLGQPYLNERQCRMVVTLKGLSSYSPNAGGLRYVLTAPGATPEWVHPEAGPCGLASCYADGCVHSFVHVGRLKNADAAAVLHFNLTPYTGD